MSSSWYARATMERDGLVLAGSHMGIGFFDMYRGEILRMVYSKWRYSLWWSMIILFLRNYDCRLKTMLLYVVSVIHSLPKVEFVGCFWLMNE
ncbi:hypothetical protein LXL04_006906 [Taraxacum kok-saghyz]